MSARRRQGLLMATISLTAATAFMFSQVGPTEESGPPTRLVSLSLAPEAPQTITSVVTETSTVTQTTNVPTTVLTTVTTAVPTTVTTTVSQLVPGPTVFVDPPPLKQG
jgi:hypothetical protein